MQPGKGCTYIVNMLGETGAIKSAGRTKRR
jgi:hypothetical protein